MSDLKSIWPDLNEMAADLGKPYPTVGAWMQRGIPARHFSALILAAAARDAVLTLNDLHAIDAEIRQRHDQKRQSQEVCGAGDAA